METLSWLLTLSNHKSQWRGALMFSLVFAWTNGWGSTRDAGDLRHHRAQCNYFSASYILKESHDKFFLIPMMIFSVQLSLLQWPLPGNPRYKVHSFVSYCEVHIICWLDIFLLQWITNQTCSIVLVNVKLVWKETQWSSKHKTKQGKALMYVDFVVKMPGSLYRLCDDACALVRDYLCSHWSCVLVCVFLSLCI